MCRQNFLNGNSSFQLEPNNCQHLSAKAATKTQLSLLWISALTPQIVVLFHSVNLSTPTSRAAGTVHCSTCIALTLPTTLVLMCIGQFAEKPTRGQTSHGLVNSWTSQLADSNDFYKSRKTPHVVHYNPNQDLTLTLIDCRKCFIQ